MIVQQGIVIGGSAIKPFTKIGPEREVKSGLGKRLFLHIVKNVDCLCRLIQKE
jgi:hypothetical protein